MAVYKNNEHFKINGDKTVEVVLRFDVGERADEELVFRCADDYLKFFAISGDHKSWGRSIEVRDV